MKTRILIGTIALFLVGGAIAVGASKSEVDDEVNVYSEQSIMKDQAADVKVTEHIQLNDETASEYISREEAIKIAEKVVNGKAYSFEKDEDDGRIEYEIELKTDRGEVEVEMNASNGGILEIDYDDLDDDDDYDD